jgi:hypothetical protein
MMKHVTTLIEHPYFLDACKEAQDLLGSARRGFVGRVCAPSGSGKSEVIIRAAQAVCAAPHLWEGGKVPIAFARASRPNGGRFSPKHLCARTWLGIHFPDLRWLITGRPGHSDEREERSIAQEETQLYRAVRHGKNEEGLWEDIREGAISRKVRYVIVEDAHAMTGVSKHINPADHVQPWIAFAEDTGVVVIFVGTNGLMKLWDGEDEAQRRARSVFVKRYRIDTPEEATDFGKLLRDISSHYSWKGTYDPVRDGEFIYLLTMGIYGQIQTLFDNASARARVRGAPGIDQFDIRGAASSDALLKKCVRSAMEYDRLIRPATLDDARRVWAEVNAEMQLAA